MKEIVLFSMPTENNREQLVKLLFPLEIKEKIVAYMPSNGHNTKQIYTDYWRSIAEKEGAEFLFVDNMLPDESGEAEKILRANILIISGGNTFELLNNLRQSGLDRSIRDFAKKEDFILSGFSAGAIVLGPTIETATVPSGNDPNDLVDENLVGLKDLTGLGLIAFEVFPHFEETKDRHILEEYRQHSKYQVREISDDGVLVLNI
jgi:peptidase E